MKLWVSYQSFIETFIWCHPPSTQQQSEIVFQSSQTREVWIHRLNEPLSSMTYIFKWIFKIRLVYALTGQLTLSLDSSPCNACGIASPRSWLDVSKQSEIPLANRLLNRKDCHVECSTGIVWHSYLSSSSESLRFSCFSFRVLFVYPIRSRSFWIAEK